ncbi:MAG: hypothetical protein JNM57_04235 [Cyclobacteriaceae bacterium]|nr:hypothetical protein [Cyclobacteriaceae bacterium]
MQKFVILISCLALYNIAIGQQPINALDAQTNLRDLNSGAIARTYDNRYEGVKGFPTLFENFLPGQVAINGEWVQAKELNYDAVNDDVLVIRNKTMVVLRKTVVKNFRMIYGTDTLLFTNVKQDETEGYYQELVTAPVALYKRVVKTVLAPDYTGAFSAHRNYAEFIQAQSYFVRKGDQKIVEIKNKKDVNQLFPELADKLKVFYKENQFDAKREDHLVALVVFINAALR